MVEGVLDGGEGGLLFAAALLRAHGGGTGSDADVDVLGKGAEREEE